ncbi:MAG TPA: hypothetical protein VG370_33890 [Chloroflexota bacterium]|nr:hypothetical protein [Chloroflexota bacterium]
MQSGEAIGAVPDAPPARHGGGPTGRRSQADPGVLARAGTDAADVAAMAARVLARCRPDGAVPPPEIKVFAPLLKEAGLL